MPSSPSSHPQSTFHSSSLHSPEKFWSHQSRQLHWETPPSSTLAHSTLSLPSGASHRTHSWFPSGQLSTTHNCVTRHVLSGHGSSPAILYDSPATDSKRTITYAELEDEIDVLAGVLREEGVKKGDVVLIYMPMIPAAIIGMLATLRLGAIHAVVFGGFSAAALAQRIDSSRPRVVLTASCGIEGKGKIVEYRPMVRGAVERAEHKPERTIVWQREEKRWGGLERVERGERDWRKLVKGARDRGIRAGNVAVGSEEGVYIIYTSGTTGSPKGVLRLAGGHAVGLNFTVRYVFGIRGPGDVLFTASDVGWVVGHSYIVYGPLLAGAATVLFEGKPVGTPDAGTFWRVVEENGVTSMFTAPTALRAIRKEDPENKHFKSRGEKGGLRKLRALFLAGERSEPTIVEMYDDLLSKYCAPKATVIDNWWSSESGSPMTALALLPSVADPSSSFDSPNFNTPPPPIKPGSAGMPMPGFDVRVVTDEGKELPKGSMGNIVLALPLAPTAFTTLWGDPERFYRSYLSRFASSGGWFDTGDAGMIDPDGYVHVMSRGDDIINVAAHRLSTGAIEQAICSHPAVTEAAVVGVHDDMKGQVPFAFIAIPEPIPEGLLADLNARLRKEIGPIASLKGFIAKPGIIPKTRSGKTLRRCLKELLQNASEGKWDAEVAVPATIEDANVVAKAKEAVKEYFTEGEGAKLKAKL